MFYIPLLVIEKCHSLPNLQTGHSTQPKGKARGEAHLRRILRSWAQALLKGAVWVGRRRIRGHCCLREALPTTDCCYFRNCC